MFFRQTHLIPALKREVTRTRITSTAFSGLQCNFVDLVIVDVLSGGIDESDDVGGHAVLDHVEGSVKKCRK